MDDAGIGVRVFDLEAREVMGEKEERSFGGVAEQAGAGLPFRVQLIDESRIGAAARHDGEVALSGSAAFFSVFDHARRRCGGARRRAACAPRRWGRRAGSGSRPGRWRCPAGPCRARHRCRRHPAKLRAGCRRRRRRGWCRCRGRWRRGLARRPSQAHGWQRVRRRLPARVSTAAAASTCWRRRSVFLPESGL